MNAKSNWNYVDLFTLHQAACLWCNLNPAQISELLTLSLPSEVVAAKQMLTGAIESGALPAGSNYNQFSHTSNYSGCFLARDDLVRLALSKGVKPIFLFDTVLAIDDGSSTNSAKSGEHLQQPETSAEPKPKLGRPAGYDWDSFIFEIIRRANTPDGLPATQAELIRDMLQWFSVTYEAEPAESSVKQRISKIYKYLERVRKEKG